MDFPSLITLFLILGVHGLAINPLLSLFSLLWVYRCPFSLFHIIYCPWFAFSLFPGSFKPIYLFKTHLFVSWAYDPLFMPLGLNGFSIRLPTPFCPCYWASPFYLGFRNGYQQCVPKSHPISNVNFFLWTTKIICIIIFLCYSKFSILVHCPHFCAVCLKNIF